MKLKRQVLDEVVHLMTLGYVLPCLHFIQEQIPQMDQALLRHFVGECVFNVVQLVLLSNPR